MNRMIVERKLQRVSEDIRRRANIPARLTLWEGQSYDLGEYKEPKVTIKVNTPAALSAFISPNLYTISEAYIQQKIDAIGNIRDIIDMSYKIVREMATDPSVFSRVARHFRHTRKSDKKAIQAHYDVSNDFFALWLDANMLYSCAYFEQGNETLEQAQIKKMDHILRKLNLQPGQRLLDVGCGWGALAMRAAECYNVRCLAITLAQNQYDYVREKIKERGFTDKVEVRLQDYRDVTGKFDRIVSVGMFEHVGIKNLPIYFHRLHELLEEDGILLNHGITSTDANSGETALGAGEFINRYIFPGGELPHLSAVIHAMQVSGFEAWDVENWRRHYVETLRHWSDNYESAELQVRKLLSEESFRIWRIYLAGCAYAFEQDDVAIYQIIASKAGRNSQMLPLNRRYLYP